MYADDSTYEAWLAREEALDRHMDAREQEALYAEEEDPGLKRAFLAAMKTLDKAILKEAA